MFFDTALILQNIVLSQHFPVELRGEIEQVDHDENDQRHQYRHPSFEGLFRLHADKLQ